MFIRIPSAQERLATVEQQLMALADKYRIQHERLTDLADEVMSPGDLDELDRLLNDYADVLDEMQELEAYAD